MQPLVQAHKARQPTSFSILGGRFKITPHTQMLHYLLEPSKALLQSALGQLMGPPQPQPLPAVGPRPARRPKRPSKPAASRPASASGSSQARTTQKPQAQPAKKTAPAKGQAPAS